MATYVVILLVGVAAVATILPIGDRIQAVPQAAPIGAVSGDGARCLGERIAIEQSGTYVTVLTADEVAGDTNLGSEIGSGRVDRSTARGTVTGECAPETDRAGQEFRWAVRFVGSGDVASRLEGPVTVGSARLDAVVVPEAAADAPVAENQLQGNELVARIFLAVAVVIVVARLLGSLAHRGRQPRVVGEIVAGILLGPSLLGIWFPEVTRYLFPSEVTSFLRILAQFGLIFFMFIIGLELEHRVLKGSGHVAVLISHVSIVVPFTLGLLVSLVLYPVLGGGHFSGFALFMGAAMAITAFPVLARILTDTGLYRTRLGAVAITCAAVDDVTAWCILAVDVAVVKAAGGSEAAQTILLSLLFLAGMIFLVRPLLSRLATVHEARGRLNPPLLAAILAGLLLCAWATEEIGIHAIFGAFLAGAVMPRSKPLAREITDKLEDITVLFLLPVFFAVVGLSTRFNLLTRPELWLLTALVIGVAVLGKFGGTLLASRATGEGWRFSAGLATLMNTRGLTEIVILTIGRSLGVISPMLFTVMVLMALATTFMATPLLSVLYPRDRIEREVDRRTASDRLLDPGAGRHRILVAVGDPATAGPLVDLALGLRGPGGQSPTIVLAHVVAPQDLQANLAAFEEVAAEARARLAPLVERVARRGIAAEVDARVGQASTEIADMATASAADLIVIGAHRPYVGSNPLGGVAGDVLSAAPVDVAVLVEKPRPADRGPVVVWYEGSRNDLAALEVAVLLAQGTGAELRILHPARVDVPDVAVPASKVATASRDAAGVRAALEGAATVVVASPARRKREAARTREELVGLAAAPLVIVQGRAQDSPGVRAPAASPPPALAASSDR